MRDSTASVQTWQPSQTYILNLFLTLPESVRWRLLWSSGEDMALVLSDEKTDLILSICIRTTIYWALPMSQTALPFNLIPLICHQHSDIYYDPHFWWRNRSESLNNVSKATQLEYLSLSRTLTDILSALNFPFLFKMLSFFMCFWHLIY